MLKMKKLIELIDNITGVDIQYTLDNVTLTKSFTKNTFINYFVNFFSEYYYPYNDEYLTYLEKTIDTFFAETWNDFITDNAENFSRITSAIYAKYNPIENYNMVETETHDEHTDTENTPEITENKTVITAPQTDIDGETGEIINFNSTDKSITNNEIDINNPSTSINYVTTFDDLSTDRVHDKNVSTGGTETTTHITNSAGIEKNVKSEIEKTLTYGETEKNLTRHGNIGVTTNQQMLKSEIEVRNFDIVNHICDLFVKNYCFMV